jgi:hypothetical protein
MTMMRLKALQVMPVLVALLATSAFAADRTGPSAISTDSAGMASSASSNVPIVSGGIGFDSQQAIAARQREFNLKLLFTLTEGNYVSNVNVQIQDAGGRTVAQHEAQGPFMLAKLPGGTYNVVATYEGKQQSRRINVAGGMKTEHFRWPSNPSTDFPAQKDVVDPPRDVTAGRF